MTGRQAVNLGGAGQVRRRPLTQDKYLLLRGTGSALPDLQHDLQQVTGVNISDHHHKQTP